MSVGQDWQSLAEHVRDRRARYGLSRRQVTDRGGPSDFTIARIERGEPGPYRGKTLMQLERALGMKPGLAEKILNGTATDVELNERPRTVAEPDWSWFFENFEPVRREAWPEAPEFVHVCLRCGALVPRYSAAFHLNWHVG